MEREPKKGEVGFDVGDYWCTKDNSRVIRFESDPLCDHLEVWTGKEFPMAYVLGVDDYELLEIHGWDVCTFECASDEMREFMVELHLENQETELLQWYTSNP